MIGIVNYNAGNIKSVERALKFLNKEYIISENPKDLEVCSKLIFPGVGDAAYAMKQLELTGLGFFIKDWTSSKKPLLGICLGSQVIFEHSAEGDTTCLGLVKGDIVHIKDLAKNNPDIKIPHMGWNNLNFVNGGCTLFDGVPKDTNFYFVHSYVIQPEDETVIKGVADYNIQIPAVIKQDNIYAFQFHPEKSGLYGLKLLDNYCSFEADKNGELKC